MLLFFKVLLTLCWDCWLTSMRSSLLLSPDWVLFEGRDCLLSLSSQHLAWCLTPGRVSGGIGPKNEWILGSRALRRVARGLWVLMLQYYIHDPTFLSHVSSKVFCWVDSCRGLFFFYHLWPKKLWIWTREVCGYLSGFFVCVCLRETVRETQRQRQRM